MSDKDINVSSKCEDTISRQAAIDFIDAGHLCNPNEPRWSDNEVVNFLKTRPSAQRWIPASERLPTNDDWVIVTILDERGDTPFRYTDIGWYLDVANCWIIDAEQRTDVRAWMPLPMPWRGDGDEQI